MFPACDEFIGRIQMNQANDSKKRKKWKHLSERERYNIELLLKEDYSVKAIAAYLDRDRRTIEREIKRGTVSTKIENPYVSRNPAVPDYLIKTYYSAEKAQEYADKKKKFKGRPVKIAHDMELIRHIENRIADDGFSPAATIGEIKVKGMQFSTQMICIKTLYNMIDRGDFYRITNKDLPVKRNKRQRKYKKVGKVAKNNKKGRSIEERPQVVNERKRFGDWEMDLVIGSGKACLLVFTERLTRKELIFKIPNKRQASVIKVIDTLELIHGDTFIEIFKTITIDNGNEFLDYEGLERSILNPGEKRTTCYYAPPYSSWERGSNENANKLIRRHIPKGANIGKYRDAEIKDIENRINNYPLKIARIENCKRYVQKML